jgi:transposase
LNRPPTVHAKPGARASSAPYLVYLRERVAAYPDLSAVRLTRELRERGYAGDYTAVKRFVAAIRPPEAKPYEVRFETPAGQQAQVDFARFEVTFTDTPGATCIVWLFSLVLGHSRHIEARFVLHQDLQTLLRCHIQAFAAMGGVPIEILYDRMKTAVTARERTATSSITGPCWRWPNTTASCLALAGPTEPKPRARSSGRSPTSARTSSWPAHSATSTT